MPFDPGDPLGGLRLRGRLDAAYAAVGPYERREAEWRLGGHVWAEVWRFVRPPGEPPNPPPGWPQLTIYGRPAYLDPDAPPDTAVLELPLPDTLAGASTQLRIVIRRLADELAAAMATNPAWTLRLLARLLADDHIPPGTTLMPPLRLAAADDVDGATVTMPNPYRLPEPLRRTLEAIGRALRRPADQATRTIHGLIYAAPADGPPRLVGHGRVTFGPGGVPMDDAAAAIAAAADAVRWHRVGPHGPTCDQVGHILTWGDARCTVCGQVVARPPELYEGLAEGLAWQGPGTDVPTDPDQDHQAIADRLAAIDTTLNQSAAWESQWPEAAHHGGGAQPGPLAVPLPAPPPPRTRKDRRRD